MIALLIVAVITVSGGAQRGHDVPPRDTLFETISLQDKMLFDAYNHCDLATLGLMVTDDLEFYHDKTGLAVGKQSFLDSIQKYICGKVTRELVPSSLEVYELAGYGAVELGVHRFHHPDEKKEDIAGEAKFVTVWKNSGGAWKVSRVISYDHESLPQGRHGRIPR
jgi:hypothetical protein